MRFPLKLVSPVILLAALSLFLLACAQTQPPPAPSGPSAALKEEVVLNYANGVYATYVQSRQSARAMAKAIDTFLANPTPATMEAAKRAWLRARDDYGPTEAYRFYGGPIDNETDGPEGLINAWPMDEAYVDYVEGDPGAGVINNPGQYPTIDAALLTELNEKDGEANISTGWHAIEFLLWGQDMNPIGPGSRPVSDYTTAANADRRGTYLAVAADLLLTHLDGLVQEWSPAVGGNYRAQFLAMDTDTALTHIITGIGELSRGELAGERMTVAFEERSQEDEHSCFSDNTTADIVGNARGILMVYTGDYGGIAGPGVSDLVAAADPNLAVRLEGQIRDSVALAVRIPAPFDQHLGENVPNSAAGRVSILDTIAALELQTDTIVDAAQLVGITLNVS